MTIEKFKNTVIKDYYISFILFNIMVVIIFGTLLLLSVISSFTYLIVCIVVAILTFMLLLYDYKQITKIPTFEYGKRKNVVFEKNGIIIHASLIIDDVVNDMILVKLRDGKIEAVSIYKLRAYED